MIEIATGGHWAALAMTNKQCRVFDGPINNIPISTTLWGLGYNSSEQGASRWPKAFLRFQRPRRNGRLVPRDLGHTE